MTITRQNNLPYKENSIVFTKELEKDYDGDGKTAMNKFDEQKNNTSVDMTQFDCFAQGSDPIVRSKLHVSDTGYLFRVGSFKNYTTGELYAKEISNLHSYISPNNLDEAFNNAELNDFITTLTPIYQAELTALYTALEGSKKSGDEIAAAVKAEMGTEDASLKDVFALLYNEEALNNGEIKNLLDLAQLHFEYLNAALILSTSGSTDASGADFALTDEAAIDAIVNPENNAAAVAEKGTTAEQQAHVQNPENNFLPAMFKQNAEALEPGNNAAPAADVGGVGAIDSEPADFTNPQAWADHFNALLVEIDARDGDEPANSKLPINTRNNSPIVHFSVVTKPNGKSYLTDEEGQKIRIDVGSAIAEEFGGSKNATGTFKPGNEYRDIKKIDAYLHSIVNGLEPVVPPVPAEPVAVTADNQHLTFDVTGRGKKDAAGADLTVVKAKVIRNPDGAVTGIELYQADGTTPVKLEGDAADATIHIFPTEQALADWTQADKKEIETAVIIQTLNTVFAQAEVDFGRSGNTTLTSTGAMDRVVAFLETNKSKITDPIKITVTGFASPDGGHTNNKTLADKRGGVVATYLSTKLAEKGITNITVVPTVHDHVATSYSDTAYYRPTRIAEMHTEVVSAAPAAPAAPSAPVAPVAPAPTAPSTAPVRRDYNTYVTVSTGQFNVSEILSGATTNVPEITLKDQSLDLSKARYWGSASLPVSFTLDGGTLYAANSAALKKAVTAARTGGKSGNGSYTIRIPSKDGTFYIEVPITGVGGTADAAGPAPAPALPSDQ